MNDVREVDVLPLRDGVVKDDADGWLLRLLVPGRAYRREKIEIPAPRVELAYAEHRGVETAVR